LDKRAKLVIPWVIAHIYVTGTLDLSADGADFLNGSLPKNRTASIFDGCVVQRLPARDLAKKALP